MQSSLLLQVKQTGVNGHFDTGVKILAIFLRGTLTHQF